jgi:hypothetical protein
VRKAGFAAVFVLVALVARAGSGALDPEDAGVAQATLTCERASSPGRVRCEAEAHVGAGESIAWGDVLLLSMPPFATALRGRIGPHDASVREATLWKWAFAIVAREKGRGEIDGRVRMVVCRARACAAREVPVAGQVTVEE